MLAGCVAGYMRSDIYDRHMDLGFDDKINRVRRWFGGGEGHDGKDIGGQQ